MDKNNICSEIKFLIEKIFELDKGTIKNNTNLLKEDLDLDSIDILELELNIKKKYNIKLEKLPKEAFTSIEKMAEFIIDYQNTMSDIK